MGQMRLQEFRAALSNALGDTALGNSMLDIWINMAYVEIQASVEHEAMKDCANMQTTAGIARYAIPDRLLGIDAITDFTNRAVVVRADIAVLKGYDNEVQGPPQLFARLGNSFVLWPVPAGVYSLEAVYWKEQAKLEEPEDVTTIPSTWDPAIFMLSVHYAASSLGKWEPERIESWLQRTSRYIQSRRTDQDYDAGGLAVPLTVVKSFDEMTRMRTTR